MQAAQLNDAETPAWKAWGGGEGTREGEEGRRGRLASFPGFLHTATCRCMYTAYSLPFLLSAVTWEPMDDGQK